MSVVAASQGLPIPGSVPANETTPLLSAVDQKTSRAASPIIAPGTPPSPKLPYERVTLPNGDVCSGWCNAANGTFQGTVTITYSADAQSKSPVKSYQGPLKDGKRHGWGSATFLNGGSYEGTWNNDKPNGLGKCTQLGEQYEGFWKDGKYHGRGKLTFSETGWTYEGEFVNGQFHGLGNCHDLQNNTRYEGNWANSQKHGRGTCYIDEPSNPATGKPRYHTIEGIWTNGVLQGEARERGPDDTEFTPVTYLDGRKQKSCCTIM